MRGCANRRMAATTDIDEVHQAIGEFVVFFQAIEDTYRQIGWFLVDPEKAAWPPGQFRKESNQELVDKVTNLLLDLVQKHDFPNGAQKVTEAKQLQTAFHKLRKLRNRVVHSAYHEVMAGGQVAAILRTNPKFTVDPDTGDVEHDQEAFDANAIRRELACYAQAFFTLHTIRMQLIHWYPFSRFKRDAVVSANVVQRAAPDSVRG